MEGRLSRGLPLFAAALIFLLPGLANADAVNSEWSSNLRALSAGNIGIASAEDPDTCAFYNPAALARLKNATVEIFNPELDFGGDVFLLSTSIADWVKISSYSKSQPLLKAKAGRVASVKWSMFPNLSAQNFSFGILATGTQTAYYNKDKDAFIYHSRKVLGPSLGISAAALGSRFRIGAAVRGIQIYETNQVNPATTASPTRAAESSRDGFGVALDGGVLMTLPWSGLPTLGVVARNVGGTSFPMAPVVALGAKSSTRHEIVPMTYDAGFSLSSKPGKGSGLTFAADYRDALDKYKVDYQRRINLGLVYSAAKFFFFRVGFAQGYFTTGFGIDAKNGSIDFGTYGEELDERGFHGVLDRRYGLRFSRRF